MKKLSEAGKLYLQDFYILNEAQNDVLVFLDAIMGQVYENLIEGIKDLSDPEGLFAWKVWKSGAKPGLLEVWPSAKKEIVPFGKGKEDLYVICRDVRREDKLSDTTFVSITIGCTHKFLNSLKRNVPRETLGLALRAAEQIGTNLDVNKKRVLYREEISLELDSASDSVDTVTEYFMERCRGVREFALQITGKK